MSDQMPEENDQGLSEGTIESNPTESGSQEESINPIWESALKNVPTEFHSQLTPTFMEWDSKFDTERNKIKAYEPYQALVDNNVPFSDIDQAMQLAHLFKSTPRDVYDYLQKQYNYTNEAPPVEPEEPEDFDLAKEGQFDIGKDPRFLELQQQTQFANQRYEEAERTRVNQEMTVQVDSEVNQVKQAYPNLDMADVANMALGMSQNSNSMPNLMEAAKHMAKYLPQERASDGAPPSLSGNRGLPSSKANFGDMTSEERSKFVADAMRASNTD